MRLRGSDLHALAASRRGTLRITFKPEQLAATNMPVLGAVGTVDPYLKDFERLKEVMPRMKLVTIPGASHGEARSRPEFLAAVKAFLAEVDGAK
jgi:pimeloyl-ACP methyl ester carboxylesterase